MLASATTTPTTKSATPARREASPSRRSFCASLAGAAAAFAVAPLILPSRVLGRATAPGVAGAGPNGQIAIGVIGTGKQSYGLIDSLLKNSAARVVAVCDVDTTRRQHAKATVDAKYGVSSGAAGCASFNDHRELLALQGLDAVMIITPDHWHAAQIIDACKAGKDIYCEKPLTLTLREGQLVIDAVRSHKRVLQTGSQQRSEFDGRFRTACEYIRSGRLGTLLSVHVGIGDPPFPCDLPEEASEAGLDWDRWLGPAPLRPYNSILSPRGVHQHYPAWRKYREYSGGYITDWGAHHYDITQWALDADTAGPVAVIPPRLTDAIRGCKLIYSTPKGDVEVFHGGPPYGIIFTGTEGQIHVTRESIASTPDSILKQPLTDADVKLPRSPGHIQNWLDCIRTREKPICDVEVGSRSIACAQLCNIAYATDRSLKWDPTKWEFAGDADANKLRDYQRREGYELPKIT
ncbi:MAG: Gfo/Idh/MocA family oxidoreductase [Planctomycetota bacterium]|nr:Gfo/Idh/MocA family oxidoreductase [Planctomycetota bacterium]